MPALHFTGGSRTGGRPQSNRRRGPPDASLRVQVETLVFARFAWLDQVATVYVGGARLGAGAAGQWQTSSSPLWTSLVHSSMHKRRRQVAVL